MISVFNMMIRLSLTGGVTCLVCLTASALLRNKMPKAWLYRLWLVVTISFLIPAPINLRLPVPQIRFPAAPESLASVAVNDALGKSTSNTAFSAQDPAAVQPPEGKQAPMPSEGDAGIRVDTYHVITVIWLAGAGGMFLWYVTGYCLTAGKLRKGRDLLTSGRIPVYENAAISTPLLVGLFRPVVYLPKDFKNPGLAVRHELCHWHRGDIWSKWFVQLTVCIHWFNPMAYLMKRELNRLSELACDEAVIRDMDEAGRQAYGQMLLDTLRVSSDLGGPMLAVVGSKKQWLRERLLGIMDKRLVTKKSVAVIAALVVIIVGTAALSGGFLSGCSEAGRTDQEKAEQTTSPNTIAATDAVPRAAVSAASIEASPSDDAATGKVYLWDEKAGVIQHDKSEQIFIAGSTRDTTNYDDTEISKLLGYHVVFPEKLANRFNLVKKSLGVELGKKFNYATAHDLDFNNTIYKAITNDSAFSELSEFDPRRSCSAIYNDEKWRQLVIGIGKVENSNNDNSAPDPLANSAFTDINSIDFRWITKEFPVPPLTQAPLKFKSAHFLLWSANGFSYSIDFRDSDQITQQEAVEFAKAFMEAQGDKGGVLK